LHAVECGASLLVCITCFTLALEQTREISRTFMQKEKTLKEKTLKKTIEKKTLEKNIQ
jgi:hypothetical protein